jgi:hypothetical protein
MTDYSDVTVATNAVTDPSTSGADLASIAGAHPSLYQAVAGHPNAYPELITWISSQGAPSVPPVDNQPTYAPQVTPTGSGGYVPPATPGAG